MSDHNAPYYNFVDNKSATLPSRTRPVSGGVSFNPSGVNEDEANQSHSAPTSPTCTVPPIGNGVAVKLDDVFVKLRIPSKDKKRNDETRDRTNSINLVDLPKDSVHKSSYVNAVDA